jgi:hypothetical protein
MDEVKRFRVFFKIPIQVRYNISLSIFNKNAYKVILPSSRSPWTMPDDPRETTRIFPNPKRKRVSRARTRQAA